MEIARVQKSLATKALYQPMHRFDDLYRYVRDDNWLESARSAIMSNNGAKTPGVDGINGQELPVSEWLAMLNQTIEELREGTYCPMPARRIYIPKANGKLLQAVNRVIRGWAYYYQYVQSSWVRQKLDHWTYEAFWKWLHRKKHGGYVGKKELYDRYLTQRNHRGMKTLGYGQVFLARMNDISFKQYYSPKGAIPNPYLAEDVDLTIAEENPIAQETWNGTSAQNKYATARQDLLIRLGPSCQMCKQTFPPEQLQAHHVKPQKEGGKHGTSNLQLLCHACHTTTGN